MALSSTSAPELWRQGVNLALPKRARVIVPGSYVNMDAQVAGPGSIVTFNEVSNLTIADYNGTDALTYSALAVEDVSLTLDSYGSVTFKVSDIDARQSQLALVTGGVEKAAADLAPYYDGKAIAALKTAGLAGSWDEDFDVADISTGDKVVGLIADAVAQLLSNGEAEGGMRALISPQVWSKLVQGKYLGSGSEAAASVLTNGTVGNIAGVDVAVVPSLTETDEEIIVYKTDAIAFAQQLHAPETLRLETSYATAFRALAIYGVKVLRSTSVVCITEADDAS